MKISLIAAFAEDNVIGKDGKIPWALKEDLKHFRNKTEGCSVVMGRKTYESIGGPLPNRLNIVMTKKLAKLIKIFFFAYLDPKYSVKISVDKNVVENKIVPNAIGLSNIGKSTIFNT